MRFKTKIDDQVVEVRYNIDDTDLEFTVHLNGTDVTQAITSEQWSAVEQEARAAAYENTQDWQYRSAVARWESNHA